MNGLTRFQKVIVSKRSGRCHFCDAPTSPDTDFAFVNGGGKWHAACAVCASSVTEQCKALVRTISAESETLELEADDLAEIKAFFPSDLGEVLAGNVEPTVAIAAVIKLGDALASLRTFAPEDDIVGALKAVAASPKSTEWERDFATSLVRQLEDGRTLSDKQRAIAERLTAPKPASAAKPAAPAPVVAEGRYALRDDDGTVKFYRVEHGKAGGKWAGFVFVSAVASDDLYPIRNRESRNAILTAIAVDPQAATALYGQELGECGRCGKALTSEYRKLGIGPVCINKAW